jgi:hypothetical protein
VSIFPLGAAKPYPEVLPIIFQKQSIRQPKGHGMRLAGWVRVQERHVYEKDRHSDKVINARGSCKYLKDFETYLA